MTDADLIAWRKTDLIDVRHRISEFKEENKDAGFWMHINELAEQFDDLSDSIKMLYLRFKWGVESKISNGRLEHIKWAIENGYRQREKVGGKISSYLKHRIGGTKTNEITPDMIERARDYPLENLVDVKRGVALCVNHADKHPSMDCRKNFAHCYSCGWSGDSIDVYRKLNGTSFAETIRRLQ